MRKVSIGCPVSVCVYVYVCENEWKRKYEEIEEIICKYENQKTNYYRIIV